MAAVENLCGENAENVAGRTEVCVTRTQGWVRRVVRGTRTRRKVASTTSTDVQRIARLRSGRGRKIHDDLMSTCRA